MDSFSLESLKNWFNSFTASFHNSNIEDTLNIRLKEEHTAKVCHNMVQIAMDVFDSEAQLHTAESIALLHDTGRFPQYAQYGTFRDSVSVNHGLLGVKTLKEAAVLDGFPQREQEIILSSVKYHNAFKIPPEMNEPEAKYLKMIRDADKLDILRVFLEHFELPVDKRPSAATLGLPEEGAISDGLLDTVLNKEIVNLRQVKTVSDYKVLQLSWIYDLHYQGSFRLLLENDYINRIINGLAEGAELQSLREKLIEYAQDRADKRPNKQPGKQL